MRRNYGEPLGADLYGDVDQVDDDEHEPLDLGRAFSDFVTLGRIGLAMHRASNAEPAPSSPGMIDMVQVAPGVYARKPTDRPRKLNPLSRLERLERAFDQLRKEIR
jgi:hypothetical protein